MDKKIEIMQMVINGNKIKKGALLLIGDLAFLLIFFSIATAQTATRILTEHEKIELLIAAVEQLQDAEFIRNEKAYKSSRASEHLRTKLKRSGNKVKTAQDFIIGIASSSSFSGKPYYIRFNDGRQITSKEFFEKKLEEINKAK